LSSQVHVIVDSTAQETEMFETLMWVVVALATITAIATSVLLLRSRAGADETDRKVRDELRAGRDEARTAARELREEIAASLQASSGALSSTLAGFSSDQRVALDGVAEQLSQLSESNQAALDRIRDAFDTRVRDLQEGNEKRLAEMRKEAAEGLTATNETITTALQRLGQGQHERLELMAEHVKQLAASNRDSLDRIRDAFDARVKDLQEGNEKRLGEMRKEAAEGLKTTSEALERRLEEAKDQIERLTASNQTALDRIRNAVDARVKELQESNERRLGEMRREATDGLKITNDTLSESLQRLGEGQHQRLAEMAKHLNELAGSNQGSLDRIRQTFDDRVKELQEGNEKKLDEMRRTVDEKLHDTLEKRLGESFKLVSDRLEAVHKGLGEMQTLATGVGDLKRVLSNVKARGTWAEVQLGALLEQVLTAEQFGRNVAVKDGSLERVEYAIRLPGSSGDHDNPVWLPIDSKFPQEDYVRLQEAAERGDPEAVQVATDALARAVRLAAKEIHDKYVNPPVTTDFAILFLATEGLYAEALRQPALVEELQQRFRIVLAGPTTLMATLSSLRMGFQTLAIERRASEVWRVLGAVKTEFGKFGDVLDKVQKQLSTASKTIEQTGVRSRAIERRLRSVERLPQGETDDVLAIAEPAPSAIDSDNGRLVTVAPGHDD
jgi:DNA recombination protein RmuC